MRTCRAAGAKVIVLTSLDTVEARDRAFDAGASAFLSKAMPLGEVMETARRVMGMESTGEPVARLAAAARAGRSILLARSSRRASARPSRCTRAATASAEVAGQMNVQYETAKTYLRRVREKYARAGRPASTKADLIRRAAEDGHLQ